MAGLVQNPQAQAQSQGIQNQATASEIQNQNYFDKIMGTYTGIAKSPVAQNGAIDYMQGSPSGVGGIGGTLISNINAAMAGIPAGAMNPSVSNQVMGGFQPALNKMASNEFYTSLGLPFGARVVNPQSAPSVMIGGNGVATGAGSAMGTYLGSHYGKSNSNQYINNNSNGQGWM